MTISKGFSFAKDKIIYFKQKILEKKSSLKQIYYNIQDKNDIFEKEIFNEKNKIAYDFEQLIEAIQLKQQEFLNKIDNFAQSKQEENKKINEFFESEFNLLESELENINEIIKENDVLLNWFIENQKNFNNSLKRANELFEKKEIENNSFKIIGGHKELLDSISLIDLNIKFTSNYQEKNKQLTYDKTIEKTYDKTIEKTIERTYEKTTKNEESSLIFEEKNKNSEKKTDFGGLKKELKENFSSSKKVYKTKPKLDDLSQYFIVANKKTYFKPQVFNSPKLSNFTYDESISKDENSSRFGGLEGALMSLSKQKERYLNIKETSSAKKSEN